MQLRIGTRKSTLALTQAEILRARLLATFPALACELAPMLTTGDKSTRPLAEIGGKRRLTKELEDGLINGSIDIAVHSLKDMESRLPADLMIGAVLPREDPRDALVSRGSLTLAALPNGARVGTSSPRRAAQLLARRPDLVIVPFRGNVPTRIEKLKKGEVDATLLALAGLKRLNLESEVTEILDVTNFTPAAGQGTIAVECRKDDSESHVLLSAVHDMPTHCATLAERSLLLALGGSCRTPVGAYARLEGDRLLLDAMLARIDGSTLIRVHREGGITDAEKMGREAGEEMLARGGKDWV